MNFLKFLFYMFFIISGIVIMRWSKTANDRELESEWPLPKVFRIIKNKKIKIVNQEIYSTKARNLIFFGGLYLVLKGITWLFVLDNGLVTFIFGIYATIITILTINLMKHYKVV